MTAPVFYKSTDTAAPTLTGQVGSLITLLDAILILGYGSQPALGWSKIYSGTNKAVYRPPAGNRFLYRVDDTGGVAGPTTKVATLFGYETMSDVDNGAGQFPPVATLANGFSIVKSNSTDGTARPWVAIGDDKVFYLFVLTGVGRTSGDAVVATDRYAFGFGDFIKAFASDTYNSFTIGGTFDTTYPQSYMLVVDILTTNQYPWYFPRPLAGTVGAQAGAMHSGDAAATNGNAAYPPGRGLISYPPADGKLWLTRALLHEGTTGIRRGTLPGLWMPCHTTPISDLDTFNGVIGLSGRNFVGVRVANRYGGTASYYGMVFLETSDTWYI